MEYYGHTADGPDGQRLLESQWQLLRDHLRNIAKLTEFLMGSAGDSPAPVGDPPNGIDCSPTL